MDHHFQTQVNLSKKYQSKQIRIGNEQTKVSEVLNPQDKSIRVNITNNKEKSENEHTKVLEFSNSQEKSIKRNIINNDEEKSKIFKNPDSFENMLDLLLKNRETLLHAQLINNVHLISFAEQSIKLRLKFKSDKEILKTYLPL